MAAAPAGTKAVGVIVGVGTGTAIWITSHHTGCAQSRFFSRVKFDSGSYLRWQITPDWKYQPDLAQASEAEVRFTAVGDGSTRVDLEHRHFERHGDGAEKMKMGVDSAQGGAACCSCSPRRRSSDCAEVRPAAIRMAPLFTALNVATPLKIQICDVLF